MKTKSYLFITLGAAVLSMSALASTSEPNAGKSAKTTVKKSEVIVLPLLRSPDALSPATFSPSVLEQLIREFNDYQVMKLRKDQEELAVMKHKDLEMTGQI